MWFLVKKDRMAAFLFVHCLARLPWRHQNPAHCSLYNQLTKQPVKASQSTSQPAHCSLYNPNQVKLTGVGKN